MNHETDSASLHGADSVGMNSSISEERASFTRATGGGVVENVLLPKPRDGLAIVGCFTRDKSNRLVTALEEILATR